MDDIPHIEGELYACLVLSTHAHANITVDFSEAVSIPGVKGYVGVDDVPGDNATGIKNHFVCLSCDWLLMSCDSHTGVLLDEEVFADGKANFLGQIIGVIVAEGQPLAQRASKLVKVTYEDLSSVITIEVLMFLT